MRKLIPSLAIAGLLATSASQAAVIVIDDFNTGAQTVAASVVPISNTVAANGAIGGFRNTAITFANFTGGSTVRANDGPAANTYSHSNDAGFLSNSKVTWDANGAGLGGSDLTDGGLNDALQIDINAIDQGNVALEFLVKDTGNVESSLTLTGLGVGQHAFFFTAFSGNADFGNVDNIMLRVVTGDASDVVLDLVQTRSGLITVPAPATIALFGLGLLGLGRLRRRQSA